MERAQTAGRNSPALQPPTKMFTDQNVMAHSSIGVASGVQILDEAEENYAKVTRHHSAANRSTLEDLLDQPGIVKRVHFGGFRQPSCYLGGPSNTNSNRTNP